MTASADAADGPEAGDKNEQVSIESLTARAERAEAKLIEHEREASRLRHDLRGILSPALLLADRLSMSDDPVAGRTAKMIIQTIERAEAALTKPSGS